MAERNVHSETVRVWRESWAGAGPLSREALIDLYEHALDALWRRAHMSLGEITLVAIVDRVLHAGSEKFPPLGALKVETSGVQFEGLRSAMSGLDPVLLDESLAFLVVELLRVFGSLTGESLTAGLQAELSKVRLSPTDEKGRKT